MRKTVIANNEGFLEDLAPGDTVINKYLSVKPSD